MGASRLDLKLFKRSVFDPPLPQRIFLKHGEKAKIDLLSCVVRRIRSFTFDFTAAMDFTPMAEGESAGVLLDHANQDYLLEYGRFDGKDVLRVSEILLRSEGSFLSGDFKQEKIVTKLIEIPWEAKNTVLRLSERENDVIFSYGPDADHLTTLPVTGDARKLNPPVTGGMVGAVVGVYASASGKESANIASFDWTEYIDL